jgi:hypothetical protein
LGDLLGVLLVALEYLETRGQKVLQLGIAGLGDRNCLERVVDYLMAAGLVVGVRFLEGRAAELAEAS